VLQQKNKLNDSIFTRRTAMEWEKPEFVEISLACEISSYANAELSELQAKSAAMPVNE